MGLSWLYNNQDFTEDLINEYYGFVYRITNNTTVVIGKLTMVLMKNLKKTFQLTVKKISKER